VNATSYQLEKTERIFKQMLRGDAAVMQKSRCCYCKDIMLRPTAEHLQPKSRGGSTERKNVRAACEPCNSAKSNGSEAWFRRTLHERDMPLHDTPMAMAWIRYRLNLRIERAEKRICKFAGMTA
jgi:5-methylcytosine-specific restriction endonuclease McrA